MKLMEARESSEYRVGLKFNTVSDLSRRSGEINFAEIPWTFLTWGVFLILPRWGFNRSWGRTMLARGAEFTVNQIRGNRIVNELTIEAEEYIKGSDHENSLQAVTFQRKSFRIIL